MTRRKPRRGYYITPTPADVAWRVVWLHLFVARWRTRDAWHLFGQHPLVFQRHPWATIRSRLNPAFHALAKDNLGAGNNPVSVAEQSLCGLAHPDATQWAYGKRYPRFTLPWRAPYLAIPRELNGPFGPLWAPPGPYCRTCIAKLCEASHVLTPDFALLNVTRRGGRRAGRVLSAEERANDQ